MSEFRFKYKINTDLWYSEIECFKDFEIDKIFLSGADVLKIKRQLEEQAGSPVTILGFETTLFVESPSNCKDNEQNIGESYRGWDPSESMIERQLEEFGKKIKLSAESANEALLNLAAVFAALSGEEFNIKGNHGKRIHDGRAMGGGEEGN
jgi:hypothetical protein